MPQAIMLLPGVGAQGAKPADLARAFTSGPASALVNASRSVIYAYRESGGDFRAGRRSRGGAAETGDMERLGLVAAGQRTEPARLCGAGRAAASRRRSAIGLLQAHAAARTHAAPPAPLLPGSCARSTSRSRTVLRRPRRRHARRDRGEDRRPARPPARAQPERLADGALHRREARTCDEARAPRRGARRRSAGSPAQPRAAGPPTPGRAGVARREPGDRRGARRARRPRRVPIASITKLMTLIVALEHLKLEPTSSRSIRERRRSARSRSTSSRAQQITVHDLVKGALIQSANDAADALALATAPSFPAFAVADERGGAAARPDRLALRAPRRARRARRVLERARRHRLALDAMKIPVVRNTVDEVTGDDRRRTLSSTPGTTCSASSRASSASRPATPTAPAGARSRRSAATGR